MATRNDKASLARYPQRNLDCRDLGHMWKPVSVYAIMASGNGKVATYERKVKCMRCPTTRVDEYSFRGALDRRKYVYAEDYRLRGWKHTRRDLATIRLAALQRHAR